MILNDDAKKLISLIKENGYNAYAVGGCVRDAIMGREAGDIDITSSATPSQLEALLEKNNIRFVETGLQHGTISAILNHIPYEITTFRCDGAYEDNRHPQSVEFVTDLKEDLARRDFTINAIAYNDKEGFVDYFGGREDIKNKIIRCVGDAEKRFDEDALRIMRAIRFASQLGFNIEGKTKTAIFKKKMLLKNIAAERIYVELIKLLMGDYVENVLLEYRDVIAVIIPEIEPCFDFHQNTKWHLYDVYTHIAKAVVLAPKKDYLRLATLLHDIGKPQCCVTDENGTDHFKMHPVEGAEMSRVILRRLKVSNEIYHKVVRLVEHHDDNITTRPSVMKRWLRNLGEELTFDLLDLKIADMASHNLEYAQASIDTFNEIKGLMREIIERNEPYLISHLAINGRDLVDLGYNGKEIADELDNLIRMVSGQPELNKREQLLKQAKKDLEG